MLAALGTVACDDSVPGPVGGLVVVVRPMAAPAGSPMDEVERVEVTYSRVEAVHRANLAGAPERKVVLDSQERTLVLANASGAADVFVAQYQVPVGFVLQVRFFPRAVTLHLKSGESVALDPDSPDLPSWRNSGWKLVPADGTPFDIRQDELSGARGLMAFEERVVRLGPPKAPAKGWKLKPTLPAQAFQVNPAPDEPGVLFDQVTLVFDDGVARARVDAINAEIGARVVIPAELVNWYRVKLPASINLDDAIRFYSSKPEVVAAMPGVRFATMQATANDDLNTARFDMVRVRHAWQRALNATGQVGTMGIKVAVIDTGAALAHPDLRRNIALNQGELPMALFDVAPTDGVISAAEVALFDLDPPGAPDGLIAIRDLELPANAAIAPADANSNGLVDAVDLLFDARWANGVNEDGNGVTATCPNGYVDDLVGWDFFTQPCGNNRPFDFPRDVGGGHGTFVAGIIGAEGDNGQGIAGASWRVSVLPLQATVGGWFTDDVSFAQAVAYADSQGAHIVNVSQGWHFAREGYDFKCGNKNQVTPNVPARAFDDGKLSAQRAYTRLFANTRALYVFAAGNSNLDLSDDGLLGLPQEAAYSAKQDHVLIVGAAAGASEKAAFSNYGYPFVELYAPGVNWASLDPAGGVFLPWSGTSFAAPMVAGVAALRAHLHPLVRDATSLKRALVVNRGAQGSVDWSCDGIGYRSRLLNADEVVAP